MSTQEAPHQPGSFNDFHSLHPDLPDEEAVSAYTTMLIESNKANPGSRYYSPESVWLGPTAIVGFELEETDQI